ncbi:hypothetical protein CYCD_06610 [Tenuifilaceae bacterium CYCD]|nr:hypothetical protein CYCD_06610 [Tenuifilaceae bacterium CYCD]
MSKMNPHKSVNFNRNRPTRLEKESFLIICEGENTEPEYFKSFRLSSARVKTISYTNKGNAINFVNEAILEKNKRGKDFDNYWVVFDMDANTKQDFNRAIQLAKTNKFKVAYSNQAFELWYLLHFGYIQNKMHRRLYKRKLDELLPFPYEKDKETAKRMYAELLNKQGDAIANAARVYNEIGNHHSPADEESSTTVYQLVESLNKFL